MGAIVAIIGEAGDPELSLRLEKTLARSPYRGAPERDIEEGFAIAIQTRGWDASLDTVGNWTVAIHGVIGNWSELALAHGWNFSKNASSATKLGFAYERLGNDLFAKLRGEYAILIHDRTTHNLIAVRDIWGRRSLFFERTPPFTFIATEIRQIRAASGTPTEIDGDVLIQEIQWRPAYPTRTHIRGISRVQAGRINTFRRERPGEPRAGPTIWEPPAGSSGHYDFGALTEELGTLIHQAVNRWLIGIPFAVSLSGGVDSSTIWWTISKIAHEGGKNAELGRPFSLIRPGHPLDESVQIKRILSATNSRGRFCDYNTHNGAEALARNCPRIDSPFYGAISSSSDFINLIRDDSCELVLSGFGGDLILAGPTDHIKDQFLDGHFLQLVTDLFTLVPPPGQNRIQFLASKTALPIWNRLKRWTGFSKPRSHLGWIHPTRMPAHRNSCEAERSMIEDQQSGRFRTRVLRALQMQQGLSAREGAEQLYASEGLDTGSPLIDLDLLNFALRIQPRALTDGKRPKHLLRAVAYDSFGGDAQSWTNPYPSFSLRRSEWDSIRRSFNPCSWILVREEIVDAHMLESLFEATGTDRIAESVLGGLVAAEAVVRHQLAQPWGAVEQ